MRPERLIIEGLTAFRERQEIDFRDLDVFTITGPTGAGKTSIFDAMSLALYGRIPRVGTSAQVRRFISHGASEARVTFEFLVDGTSYGVTRRYRAASSVSDVTLERLDEEDGPIELASGQRAATARITQLIGMDYEAFQRAVLLPQGQFDLFLTGDPGERRAVLIRLLDLERYVEAGRRAREQAREIVATVAAHDSRLGALGHATASTRRERIHRRDAAKSRADVRAEQIRRARAERAASVAAGERARQLERDTEGWSRLATRVEELGRDARSAHEVAASSETEAAAARAELAAAEERVAEWEQQSTAVIGRVGTVEQHAAAAGELDGRRRAIARLDTRRAELGRARTDSVQATAGLAAVAGQIVRRRDALASEIRKARARREDFTEALAQARAARLQVEGMHEGLVRRHVAAGLRSEVHAGEDCPVCDRLIEHAPPADVQVEHDLDSARRGLDAARADETEAAAALAESEREIVRLEAEHDRLDFELSGIDAPLGSDLASARLATAADDPRVGVEALRVARAEAERTATMRESAEQRVADAEQEVVEAQARLGTVLGAGAEADPEAELVRRRRELAAVEEALARARAVTSAARGRRERALEELSRRAEADRTRQQQVGELRGRAEALLARTKGEEGWPELPPLAWPTTVEALDDDLPRRLRDCADVLRRATRAATEGARAAEKRIERLAAGNEDGWASDRGDPLDALSGAHESAIIAAAEAERDLVLLEEEITERAEIEGDRDAKRLRAERLEWVASHLRDDGAGFLAYVIAESLETLCELASARLEQMSERRYALHADADGSFQVIDAANAGERRDVETLSGGETFLVSFALALALSESITNYGDGHGALLEAIFIDEGFSALDTDSLEVALDALETMGHAEQRMIGLVSHVERVPERIPDGIDVVKGAGSSRIRRRQGVADPALLPG